MHTCACPNLRAIEPRARSFDISVHLEIRLTWSFQSFVKTKSNHKMPPTPPASRPFIFLIILEFRVKRRISSKNPLSYSCVYSLYHFHDFLSSFVSQNSSNVEVRDKRNILFCVIVERWHCPISYLAFNFAKILGNLEILCTMRVWKCFNLTLHLINWQLCLNLGL